MSGDIENRSFILIKREGWWYKREGVKTNHIGYMRN